MLTDYGALPEFVPNLALCERLPLPKDSASRMVRLRQVSPLRLGDGQLFGDKTVLHWTEALISGTPEYKKHS